VAAGGIQAGRFWRLLMELAEFTDPNQPWTRQAFTARHAEGRRWLSERMRELKLEVFVDPAGNLCGRRPGTEPGLGAIAIGSHSDTVAGGGRFDGIAGVIAGLEIAATLNDRGASLRHPLEVIDFLAEEPNEFGLSCIGSRGIAGALSDEMLERKNARGGTLGAALPGLGARPGPIAKAVRRDLAAFFELHIEQGPILEHEGLDVGIVTHIVGIRRLAVGFKGQAAHAGTMPLALRQDALIAASRFVIELRALLEARAEPGFVIGTVGDFKVIPNAPNVVPGEVQLIVDLRSDRSDYLASWTDRLKALAVQCAEQAKLSLARFEVLSASEPAPCAAALSAELRAAAQAAGFKQRDMVSGAGHDCAFVSRVAPAAMLFVPSVKGLSHCAEEWTEPEAFAKGLTTLIGAVESFDARAPG
jgi:beta-ureidopropionase / N-carbamoyl-L-amino-acid hydrolase